MYAASHGFVVHNTIKQTHNKDSVLKLAVKAYVEVIVLNLSCPAVSQICSFTFSPLMSMVRILKSTPIVVMYVPVGGTQEHRGKEEHVDRQHSQTTRD